MRHCSGSSVYATVSIWGETDFMWREEAAINGSTDADHVSLRVFNLPNLFLCAADTNSMSINVMQPTSASLCTFRKVAGLSDPGLVSFVNEGRYLSVGTTVTGLCATWLSSSQAVDVQLNAFPPTKESATWAPVETTFVAIKNGFYWEATPYMHYCNGSVTATATSSVSNYDFIWVIEKGLDTTDPLSISIRAANHMNQYFCLDGSEAKLRDPSGAERQCSFVVKADPQARLLGGIALYNNDTGTFLTPKVAQTTSSCTGTAAFKIGNTAGSTSGNTSWSLLRIGTPAWANISTTGQTARKISSTLFGITLEDANFGSDGGLYAQLIRNRDFESLGRGILGDGMNVSDISVSTDMRPWTVATTQGTATVGLTTATHPFDTNPVALSVAATAAATVQLTNPGYWGIAVALGTSYKGSVRAKSSCAWSASAVLRDTTDDVSTTWTKSIEAGDWAKMEFTLMGQKTSTSANFVFGVAVTGSCTVWLDSFSLIPADAVLGLFRKDVYTALAALKPSYVQFPWGKTLEGTSADTRWSFGTTLGEADARPGHCSSAWGSWSTDGLGLHEFLLLAESLAAHPILSLFAGRVVHMIEYANGAATTTYGAMRKSNGHTLPFNVREVQIGSGYDNLMANYTRFFTPMAKAIAAAFPGINITASGASIANNPCLSNRTFCTTWSARFQQFQSTMLAGVRKYDNYDRSLPLVSVTNAAQATDTASVDAAAAEGAWIIGMERNADVVAHYSLAPALRNNNAVQMNVALMAFDSGSTQLLPSYHVHRMVAEAPCSYTLTTTVPTGTNAISCRTPAGNAVFRAANWASSPQVATFVAPGSGSAAAAATTVSITLLAGASPTSTAVAPVTWNITAVRKVSVVLPRYSFAVVVFESVLPMENATMSSSSSSDPCSVNALCRSCLTDSRCGWCDSLQTCFTSSGPSDIPAVCAKRDWRFDTCSATTASKSTNTDAIIGGAVGGGGFMLVVVSVAVVVAVVRAKERRSAPNIPIDNVSVDFVATSTAFDPTMTGADKIITPPGLGGSAYMSPGTGGSSSSSMPSPKVDLGVLTSVNTQLQVSTDLMAASLQAMPLGPLYPYGVVPPPPPPADTVSSSAPVISFESTSVESTGKPAN
eukprot:m51a1_g8929 putative alpha-L-arabinofuranosidase (1117) ;mRNA; r:853659-857699